MMGLRDKAKEQYAKAKAAQPTKHKLGPLVGTIYEFSDGSASYRQSADVASDFRVQISEITGFALVRRSATALTHELQVLGHGTTLATVGPVSAGQARKIEEWFRSHPRFGAESSAGAQQTPNTGSTGDELRKLADLRAEGVLTEAEFAEQKARLLA